MPQDMAARKGKQNARAFAGPGKSAPRRKLESLEATLQMPAHLEEKDCKAYLLLDERHQAGRAGCRCHKPQILAVAVGHSFAMEAGGWPSAAER